MVKGVTISQEKFDLEMKLMGVNLSIRIMYNKLVGGFDYDPDMSKIFDYSNDSFEPIRMKLLERSLIFKRLREIVKNHGTYNRILREHSLY
jgi:hypothetical protein